MRRTEEQLRHLHNGAAHNNTQAQPFGQRVLETFNVAEVKVLDDRGVTFLNQAS